MCYDLVGGRGRLVKIFWGAVNRLFKVVEYSLNGKRQENRRGGVTFKTTLQEIQTEYIKGVGGTL